MAVRLRNLLGLWIVVLTTTGPLVAPAQAQLCGASVSTTWGKPGTTVHFNGGGIWYGGCHADNPYFWLIDGQSYYWYAVTKTFYEPGTYQWSFCTWQAGCSQCCDDGSIEISGDPLPSPTPASDLIAEAIEVTQAVQDLNQSTRLVAGKPTVVRFHVRSQQDDTVSTARLRVERGGSRRSLLPVNGEVLVSSNPYRGWDIDSFQFVLPSGFTAEGDTKLTAELNPENDPPEVERGNNEISTTVRFESVPPMSLVLYNVKYTVAGVDYEAGDVHIDRLFSWLQSAYPIRQLDSRQRRLTFAGGQPTCDQINATLGWARLLDLATGSSLAPNARYYGLVSDAGGFMRGCAMAIPSFVASGPTGDDCNVANSGYAWDCDGSYGDWYAGHELAHSYGRYHAEYCGALARDSRCVGGANNGGYCNNNAHCPGGACQPEPYPADFVAFPNPDGLISPATNGATAAFGYDVHDGQIYPTNWTDLMTYCSQIWMSEFTTEGLMDQLRTEGRTARVARAAATDRLLIVGTIDPGVPSVLLEPLQVVPGAADVKPRVPGEYTIILRDAAKNELARYPFAPDTAHEESGDADAPPPRQLLFISELVPYITGTTHVDIEGPGISTVRISAGASPPTVSLIAPAGGTVLSNDPIEVRWSASDPDGDELRFAVQFSADDGQSWETIAHNLTGSSTSVERSSLRNTAAGRLRVWASDGIHSASATSAPFTIPNQTPQVKIVKPEDDITVVTGRSIQLQANAYDTDLGALNGTRITWRSDRSGALGSGASLALDGLTAGTHTITVEADDDSGGVATDSVVVNVVRSPEELPTPAPALRVAPASVSLGQFTGAQLRVGSSDPSRPLRWLADADANWVRLSATSGDTPATIGVSARVSGLPIGEHRTAIVLTSPDIPGFSVAVKVRLAVTTAGEVCAGDCDGSGSVTVDEMISGIRIALGAAAITACPKFDAGKDGQVTVDELVTAVANALTGCSTPAPSTPTQATPTLNAASPTPSRTANPTSSPTVSATGTPSSTATRTPTMPSTTPSASPTPSPTAETVHHCSVLSVPLAIPDNDSFGVGDSITITRTGVVHSLKVDVFISHTWVGDLSVALTRLSDLTTVVLVDRPGYPSSPTGCLGHDISCLFSDGALLPAENACANAVPALAGNLSPSEPLATFEGQAWAGTWMLTVADEAPGDTGSLVYWCLDGS